MADRIRMRQGRGDVDVPAWVNAVQANGGTVTAQRLMIVSAFIAAEKAAGTWALTDDYWALWGENAVQSLTSLKQRRLAAVTAAPSFVADAGYTFNGTTQFINTGFVASTHGLAMTGSNQRIAVYERTNVASVTYSAGAVAPANVSLGVCPRYASGMFGVCNGSGNLLFNLPVADSRGYTSVSLAGNTLTDAKAYKNGTALVNTNGATTFVSTLVNFAIYIGGGNSSGTVALPRACSVGLCAVGAALSAAQELAQYNNVQAWATSVGANV